MVFDPNFTQTVVLKAKRDMTLIGKAMLLAHKTLPVYFCYLVGLSVTVQDNVASIDGYIPTAYKVWEHRILVAAAVLVFIDKTWRSRPKPE